MKAKQKALVEQIEKDKIQSNKGSSYKLLVEQAKLKQATSKVSSPTHTGFLVKPDLFIYNDIEKQQLLTKMLHNKRSNEQ